METQIALDERWYEDYRATQEAGGGPPTPTMSAEYQTIATYVARGEYPPTSSVLRTPIVGRHGECWAPSKRIEYSDCWSTILSGVQYEIAVFAAKATPQQSIVMVYTLDSQRTMTPAIQYPAPQSSNPLQVQRTEGILMYLAAKNAMNTTLFTFNLETRQWTSLSGTPLPPTPTATPTTAG